MSKNRTQKYKPIHPGEVLQEALHGADLSQSALAKHIGVSQSKINDICRGRRGISLEMAARLGQAFGMSMEFWYNLQKQYELDSFDRSDYEKIGTIAA
ncbi:MAG: HigA family addiction module antidote protein [Candidatus Omnitrophica bacterium]|nr:HigA family addiction module antidote protein [Candidatus Omnitrophota bacterium]MCB9769685.1 HigA family addiction module antidote protein [Candidatus Omnitrophota bacterium]MCB9782090.1 HigA family addiction module antidote protein [Candidatus Omnitrophota bacterium]